MKRIVCELQKCMGCRTCQIACAVAHSKSKDLFAAITEEPRPRPRVMVEYVEHLPVPIQCQHCEDAPCVRVCPTHAIVKDASGATIVHAERCIGCTWCVLACPFGAIRMGDTEKAIIKCDLCVERQAEGKGPACVEACPTHALHFQMVEEVARAKRIQMIREYLLGTEEPGKTPATLR